MRQTRPDQTRPILLTTASLFPPPVDPSSSVTERASEAKKDAHGEPAGADAPCLDDLPEKFSAKVEQVESGCWEWRGQLDHGGYGQFYAGGRRYRAHRFSYTETVGPIPQGLEIDHLCRNRSCVNPEHLEPVTRRENLLRSPLTFAGQKAAQTHCYRGHEFTDENTQVDKLGRRYCRACRRHAKHVERGVSPYCCDICRRDERE